MPCAGGLWMFAEISNWRAQRLVVESLFDCALSRLEAGREACVLASAKSTPVHLMGGGLRFVRGLAFALSLPGFTGVCYLLGLQALLFE